MSCLACRTAVAGSTTAGPGAARVGRALVTAGSTSIISSSRVGWSIVTARLPSGSQHSRVSTVHRGKFSMLFLSVSKNVF